MRILSAGDQMRIRFLSMFPDLRSEKRRSFVGNSDVWRRKIIHLTAVDLFNGANDTTQSKTLDYSLYEVSYEVKEH